MTLISTVSTMAIGLAELVANNDNTFPGGDLNKAVRDSTAAFRVVQAVFSVIGIGVVVWTAKGVIQALIGAKPVEAAKKLVGGILAAVLCFRLSLPLSMVEGLGNLLDKVFTTFNNTLKD